MSHTISNITKTLFLATATLLALGVHAATPDEIMTKSNCMPCHSKDKKVLGPAFKDVAAKYKGQDDAVTKLEAKVRKGGSGVFGPIPMPPNDKEKINDADLKVVIEAILKT